MSNYHDGILTLDKLKTLREAWDNLVEQKAAYQEACGKRKRGHRWTKKLPVGDNLLVCLWMSNHNRCARCELVATDSELIRLHGKNNSIIAQLHAEKYL